MKIRSRGDKETMGSRPGGRGMRDVGGAEGIG